MASFLGNEGSTWAVVARKKDTKPVIYPFPAPAPGPAPVPGYPSYLEMVRQPLARLSNPSAAAVSCIYGVTNIARTPQAIQSNPVRGVSTNACSMAGPTALLRTLQTSQPVLSGSVTVNAFSMVNSADRPRNSEISITRSTTINTSSMPSATEDARKPVSTQFKPSNLEPNKDLSNSAPLNSSRKPRGSHRHTHSSATRTSQSCADTNVSRESAYLRIISSTVGPAMIVPEWATPLRFEDTVAGGATRVLSRRDIRQPLLNADIIIDQFSVFKAMYRITTTENKAYGIMESLSSPYSQASYSFTNEFLEYSAGGLALWHFCHTTSAELEINTACVSAKAGALPSPNVLTHLAALGPNFRYVENLVVRIHAPNNNEKSVYDRIQAMIQGSTPPTAGTVIFNPACASSPFLVAVKNAVNTFSYTKRVDIVVQLDQPFDPEVDQHLLDVAIVFYDLSFRNWRLEVVSPGEFSPKVVEKSAEDTLTKRKGWLVDWTRKQQALVKDYEVYLGEKEGI